MVDDMVEFLKTYGLHLGRENAEELIVAAKIAREAMKTAPKCGCQVAWLQKWLDVAAEQGIRRKGTYMRHPNPTERE